jgi:Type II/IV secretion system protein
VCKKFPPLRDKIRFKCEIPCETGTLKAGKDSIQLPDDFTVFMPSPQFDVAIENAWGPAGDSITDRCRKKLREQNSFNFDHPIIFENLNRELEFSGRLHAIRCCGRSYTSITFRSLKATTLPQGVSDVSCTARTKEGIRLGAEDAALECTVEGEPKFAIFRGKAQQEKRFVPEDSYLAPQSHLGRATYDAIFEPERDRPSGLVLISGETGCGKTTVLNEVLFRYLDGLLRKQPRRNPHVVVVGDPIETRMYVEPNKTSAQVQSENVSRCVVDFTERVLGEDTETVADALTDALRETPKAVVIGELRAPEDFRATLDFAATGHLVFATAHTTSLVDAVGKLSRIFGANNPAKRAALAQRIRAVVHLRPIPVELNRGSKTATTITGNLATTWRCNSDGIRQYVCEGLSSLHAKDPRGDSVRGVLGLTWYLQKLREYSCSAAGGGSGPLCTHLWSNVVEGVDPFEEFRKLTDHIDLHSY